MRRSYLLLAAAAVPTLVALAFGHGCSGETNFESVCDWVADPDNCFREFRAGMLAEVGPSALAPGCTFDGPQPTQVDDTANRPTGIANGAFLTTGMLGTCIINTGGQVTINPPINLAAYPPSLESTPITYTFTFLDESMVECGSASYTSPHGFSVTISAPTGVGGGGGGTSGTGGSFTLPDAGFDGGFEATPNYGTYTQTIAPGRDAFDATCPSGETHHLNLDESVGFPGEAGTDQSACPGYAALVPEASLQINPGSTTAPGAVSFAIVYPNATATYPPFQAGPSGSGFNPDAKPPAPQTVVYFNCTVPEAAPQCADGMKDGAETDTDCGGPSINGCPTRCLGGQACLCNDDCASDICFVNPTNGARQCYDKSSPPMTSTGMVLNVGDGVGKCGYKSICGAPNTQCGPSCSDITTDANNCGKCGNACMSGDCCTNSSCASCTGAGGSGGSGGSGGGAGGSGTDGGDGG